MISTIVIKKYTDFHFINKICSILFSLIILETTSSILERSIHKIVLFTPEEIDVERIRREFYFIQNVIMVRNFNFIILTEDKYICCLNLIIKG